MNDLLSFVFGLGRCKYSTFLGTLFRKYCGAYKPESEMCNSGRSRGCPGYRRRAGLAEKVDDGKT